MELIRSTKLSDNEARRGSGNPIPSIETEYLDGFVEDPTAEMHLEGLWGPQLPYSGILPNWNSVYGSTFGLAECQGQPSARWKMPEINPGVEFEADTMDWDTVNHPVLEGQLNNETSLTGYSIEDEGQYIRRGQVDNSRITEVDLLQLCSPFVGPAGERTSATIEHGSSRSDLGLEITDINTDGQPKAPRRTYATPEDWVSHRRLITRLYERMALPKAMQHMEQEQGFYATIKMYKTRIALWGLDNKNKSDKEMRAAVRKFSQRTHNGKATKCRLRGKSVDYTEMVRYFARKSLSIEDVIAKGRRRTSKTPEKVVCLTPITSPITSPGVYEALESLFTIIRSYVAGSFGSGTWTITEQGRSCYSVKRTCSTGGEMSVIEASFYESCDLLDTGASQEAEWVQKTAMVKLRQAVYVEEPYMSHRVLKLVDHLFTRGRLEVALNMLAAVADLGASTLGQQHPIPSIARLLMLIKQPHIGEVVGQCHRALADHFENVLGPLHTTALHIRSESGQSSVEFQRNLFFRCQAKLGLKDRRTIEVHSNLVKSLYQRGLYPEAMKECEWILGLPHMTRPVVERNTLYIHAFCLHQLASCHYMLRNRQPALATLREAIDVQVFHGGPWDSLARNWIVHLQNWLAEYGREDELAEARRWWNLMIGAEAASRLEAA